MASRQRLFERVRQDEEALGHDARTALEAVDSWLRHATATHRDR